jgi:hypothetical protein
VRDGDPPRREQARSGRKPERNDTDDVKVK